MSNLVNISIDDVSPHPKSSTNVLNRCFEIIDVFPDIKFSLFIPISYWRTIKPQIATKNPLQINMFPDFCKEISELPSNNFEICYHGYYHGIPGKSDNDEFQNLNYKDANDRFAAMFEVTKLAKLDKQFKNIFRPPAWRMSPSAIKAARDLGFNLLALSPDDYAKKTYGKEEYNKNDVVYYNCAPPLKDLAIYEKTEIVYHACEWDKNYLCANKTHSLIEFLKNNRSVIEFKFLEALL
jgi:predicted deacetylase